MLESCTYYGILTEHTVKLAAGEVRGNTQRQQTKAEKKASREAGRKQS